MITKRYITLTNKLRGQRMRNIDKTMGSSEVFMLYILRSGLWKPMSYATGMDTENRLPYKQLLNWLTVDTLNFPRAEYAHSIC